MKRVQTITVRIEIRGEFDAEATHGQITTLLDEFKEDTEGEFEGVEVSTTYTVTEVPL
jgi:hypothetical protein